MVEMTLTPNTEITTDGQRILLRRGDSVTAVSGEPAVSLVRELIESSHNGSVQLPDATDPQEVAMVQDFRAKLQDAGLAVPPEQHVEQAGPLARELWMRSGQELDVLDIDHRLRAAKVAVIGEASLGTHVRNHLGSAGLGGVAGGSEFEIDDPSVREADLVVAIAPQRSSELLTRVNEWALEAQTPWLAVTSDEAGRPVVGPYIVPGSSACFECFRMRRAANFPERSMVGSLTRSQEVAHSVLDSYSHGRNLMLAGLIVEKVTERIGLGENASATAPGYVAVLEPAAPGWSVKEHRVLRVPRCPKCSPTAGQGQPQVWFHDASTVGG